MKETISDQKSDLHKALILISSDLVAGIDRLKKIGSEISELSEIQEISSVYKKFLNIRSEDLNSELVVVLKVQTAMTSENLFDCLKQHKSPRVHQQLTDYESLSILCYDDEVRMFPGQNLPSPLLHSDALALRCAAEVWGHYRHPVLKKTLNELVKSNPTLNHVEFFAQGNGLK